MKHATVERSGWTIPLIGIPQSATLEECDRCRCLFHIRRVVITDGRFLCFECFPFHKPQKVAGEVPRGTQVR